MSFYLGPGRSPFALLRRQLSFRLSTSLSPGPSEDKAEAQDADDELSDERDSFDETQREDLTQDSKDVLIDRLNDLVKQLSNDGSIRDATIDLLHAKADEMERAISGGEQNTTPAPPTNAEQPSAQQGPAQAVLDSTKPDGDQLGEVPQAPRVESPEWLIPPPPETEPAPIDTPTHSEQHSQETTKKPSSEAVDRLAEEAQKLHLELSSVLKGLQARREESDVSVP